jgi:hypothetical protein
LSAPKPVPESMLGAAGCNGRTGGAGTAGVGVVSEGCGSDVGCGSAGGGGVFCTKTLSPWVGGGRLTDTSCGGRGSSHSVLFDTDVHR